MLSRKTANLKPKVPAPPKTHCQICENKFQLISHQQHQCKRCLRAVCDKCYTQRIKIFQADGTAPSHKVCTLCKKEQDIINSLIKDNNLVFQMSSRLSEQWMKKLNKQRLTFQQMINEYEQMKFLTNGNTIKFKSQSKRIIEDLLKNYNYSLRQFIGKLTQELNNLRIAEAISNVTLSLYGYLKNMPYTPELIYLVSFILCFCSEFQCYFIISRFIEKVYPQYLRLQNLNKDNLLTHQLKMLMDMYKILSKKAQKDELSLISNYLQNKFLSFVKSFTINLTTVAISFYLTDEMFTNNSYIYLYKVITSIVYNSREIVCQPHEAQDVEAHILTYINLEKLKNTMILFEKSNTKFEMEYQFFDSAEHRKLHEKYKLLQSSYQKSEYNAKLLQSKYKALSKEHEQTTSQLAQCSKKLINIQQELISLGDKLILIDDFDRLKEQNELLSKSNKYLSEELVLLQKNYQEINKKYSLEEVTRKMYLKFQEDYEKQIVQLKTKNEVLEIQKQANNINFQTTFIQQKFEEKNRKIAQVQKSNNELQHQLEFYRNSRPNHMNLAPNQKYDGLFRNSLSTIHKNDESRHNFFDNSLTLSHLQLSTKEEKDSLKRLMDTNKEIIQKLKTELKHSQAQRERLQKQVKQLSETVESQNLQMLLNGQIHNFINQIPQELNYSNSMQDLEQIIAKQPNLHKKTQLEAVLNNFNKCLYEVRYRSIDAKLKQNKIKQIQGQPILESPPTPSIQQRNKDLATLLSWFGSTSDIEQLNKKVIKKEECRVM